MSQTKEFLGRGFKFPIQLDASTGQVFMCKEEEDIKQAIYIILMTKKYERVMFPEFGCDIHNYIFDLPDLTFQNLLKNEIIEALTMWESRIIDIDVELDTSEMNEGKLIINISYVVRSTNNPNNLVFPYYLNEGVGDS